MQAKLSAGNTALIAARCFLASIRRSRLKMVLVTVLAWFTITAVMGTIIWFFHEPKHPWLVYFYNAFTIFSNLNDDLGLAVLKSNNTGDYSVNIWMMVINFLLIVSGMIGIAVLTASITQQSISDDEERFDSLIDEFRRLALIATAPVSYEEMENPHRILKNIIGRIHNEIVPIRHNTSLHQLNIYEFEYMFVHLINRIIMECKILQSSIHHFAVYDLEKISDIVLWAKKLDSLHPHFSDTHPSPINSEFKRAWNNFAHNLPARISLYMAEKHPTEVLIMDEVKLFTFPRRHS